MRYSYQIVTRKKPMFFGLINLTQYAVVRNGYEYKNMYFNETDKDKFWTLRNNKNYNDCWTFSKKLAKIVYKSITEG